MRAGDEEVAHRVFLVGFRPFKAFAAATLRAVLVERGSLDVTVRRDRNDHRFLVDEVFVRDVSDFLERDFGAAFVGELVFDLFQVLTNDRQNVLFVRQNAAELRNVGEERVVLVGQFLLFEVDQLTERHAKNRVRLHRRERVAFLDAARRLERLEAFVAERSIQERGRALDLHQALFRLELRRRRANDANHFVDVGVRDQQTLDGVLTLNRFVQKELRSTANDRDAVPQELDDQLFERHNARFAVDQREQNNRERVLQRGVLVKLVQDDVRVGVFLQVENETHRLFQVGFVANRRNPDDAPFVDHFGDLFFDAVAGLLVRNFRNNNPASFPVFFDASASADDDVAASGQVAATNPAGSADDAAGREVRARADAKQLERRNIGVVDRRDRGVADFAEVVRRNARRHPDGDTVRAVDEKVRRFRRQDGRLHSRFVVSRDEVDGVEVQVFEERHRHSGEARFGVTHRGGGKTGDRTEVPLFVDEDVPHIPFLRHPSERRVNDLLPVRVVVPAGVAGNLRAFDALRMRAEAEVVHRDQNAALRRFQTVSNVRNRAADDNAHRVSQVASLQLVFDGELNELRTVRQDELTVGVHDRAERTQRRRRRFGAVFVVERIGIDVVIGVRVLRVGTFVVVRALFVFRIFAEIRVVVVLIVVGQGKVSSLMGADGRSRRTRFGETGVFER